MSIGHQYLTSFLIGLASVSVGAAQPKDLESQSAPQAPPKSTNEEKIEKDSEQDKKPPLTQWHIIPIPFYTPETSVGLSILFAYLWRVEGHRDARLSHNISSASATIRGQFQFENRGEFYRDGEKWAFNHQLIGKLWPDRFFGIGNTGNPGVYDQYQNRSFELLLDPGYLFWRRWYIGPMMDLRYANPIADDPTSFLATGTLPGSQPHWALGMGGSLSWDTRNNNLNTTKGIFQESIFLYYPPIGPNQFEFARVDIDFRGYLTLVERHVIATRAMTSMTFGSIPFTLMPYVGGHQRLRGIVENWVRDKVGFFAVTEYRWNFWWRLGLATFIGVGQTQSSWDRFTFRGIHVAGGTGLRLLLLKKEKINLRVDFAYSDFERFKAYVSIGESF